MGSMSVALGIDLFDLPSQSKSMLCIYYYLSMPGFKQACPVKCCSAAVASPLFHRASKAGMPA